MKNTVVIISALVLTSCASAKLDYFKPEKHEIENTRKYAKSFNDVWNALVEGLSKKNFSMDSVNKESGLIVASKKVEPPAQYSDCGYWQGYFKNTRGDNNYLFGGADSAVYSTLNDNNVMVNVNKMTKLNAKLNILIKKTGKISEVQINATYVLGIELKTSGYVYPQGNFLWKDSKDIEWTTTTRGMTAPWKTECISNSVLEKEILDIVP